MFTGKAEKQFNEWLYEKYYKDDALEMDNYTMECKHFESLPLHFQQGVFLRFLSELGYCISICKAFIPSKYYFTENSKTIDDTFWDDYDTAFLYVIEKYNYYLNKQ